MSKASFVFALILFSFHMASASNSCQPENVYTYKSIECCLGDELSKDLCHKKIDQLDPNLVTEISIVKSDILAGVYPYKNVPNCFWLALAFQLPDVLNKSEAIAPGDFSKKIEAGIVASQALTWGDLVLFSGEVIFEHDFFHEQVSYDVLYHAGVYVGDNLILQKENIVDSVFSLVPLDQVYKSYGEAFLIGYGSTLKMKYIKLPAE